jgi:hypothetical protein
VRGAFTPFLKPVVGDTGHADTRVETLRAPWEADGDVTAFSELREVVGIRDSGQFGYHLDGLVGWFVDSTEDGHGLTQAGVQVDGTIAAGTCTAEGLIDPIPLAEPCPSCGKDPPLRGRDRPDRV